MRVSTDAVPWLHMPCFPRRNWQDIADVRCDKEGKACTCEKGACSCC